MCSALAAITQRRSRRSPRRPGLSNGAIYYNFGSKEELFLALLDARLDERLEHTRQTLDQEARDITRSFKESREWRLLLVEFVAYAARNPLSGTRLGCRS